ncbi:AB hydrolase-1 domain-containing protein [Mycena venus]|uniref:AB hydrolase-1 domain-containing protein n=1 Tax=Mycena venus TaxID=2733690 RepID=A0A8H6XD73_9AGAR|nr:AB hydrolase-1 domain-containing protein [Mycena venus]
MSLNLGGLFKIFALIGGFMGALFSASRRGAKSSVLVHFSEKPASLKICRPDGSVSTESLKSLVETRCASLFSKFNPVWWLFSGHLQTIYCVLGDFSKTDVLQYNRQLIRLEEGGTLGLDFAPADHSKVREDAPIIVVLHGLTGGSYESYVRSILVPATKPVEEGGLGYRAVVVNYRGCAGVPVTSSQFYSAGYTGDIRQALIYISQLYPRAPLLGIGFSLGANILTRYLAEEGEQSRLRSGCALACPWDLAKNNDGLRYSFTGRFYSKAMATNLVNLVERNLDGLSKFPDALIAKYIPTVLKMKGSGALLDDFDNTFTRIAGGSAPDFPFETAYDYYRWGSSHNVVSKIRVPYLAINAADDPVVQHVPMDGGGNGLVCMALTASGGHLGWFSAGTGGKIDRWIKAPVLEWMSLIGGAVVHPTSSAGRRIYLENGYYREEGRDGGCKEIEGGGLVEASSWQGVNLQGL